MMSKAIDQNQVLDFIRGNPGLSSKEIYDGLKADVGYATIKRILKDLLEREVLNKDGRGKSTRYKISDSFEILATINLEDYFKIEIDERKIKSAYNHALLDTLSQISLFTKGELIDLQVLQSRYEKNIKELSSEQYDKEMERLAIDLSWKSSQIEGNTYSLLETEYLLKEKQTAAGKTRDEATMLLNHKDALDFIIENPEHVIPLNVTRIEEIHSILVKDLGVERNIRIRRVGISGTNYRPLENDFQIREALQSMCNLINTRSDTFSKALLALALLSYIQPFADGNKRTARIVSNAILVHYRYCPLSFRTVDSITYKKAMLVFYEQNNISELKKIFIDQFRFAVNTYF